MLIPENTKVVFIRPGVPHRKVGEVGTVVETLGDLAYIVDWDCGEQSVVALDAIVPRHALKAAFKHGPKIRKRDLL